MPRDIAPGAPLPPLSRKIDRVRIARYAGASGDFNPMHVDEDFAKQAGMGGTIAHGLLSVGLVGQFLVDWASNPAAVKRLRLRFAGIVRPGDIVTIKGQVVEVEPLASGQRVTVSLLAENQNGEKVLTGGQAVLEVG